MGEKILQEENMKYDEEIEHEDRNLKLVKYYGNYPFNCVCEYI